MATKSSCNDHLKQPQAVIDLAADKTAKTQATLEELNQSTISVLEETVKGNPAVDLWPYLREAARNYKAKRDECVGKPTAESRGTPFSKILTVRLS